MRVSSPASADSRVGKDNKQAECAPSAERAAKVDPLATDPMMHPISGAQSSADLVSTSHVKNTAYQAERAAALNTLLSASKDARTADGPSNRVAPQVIGAPRGSSVGTRKPGAPNANSAKRGVLTTNSRPLLIIGIVLIVVCVGTYIQTLGDGPGTAGRETPDTAAEPSSSYDVYVKSPYETGADEYVLPYSDSHYYSTEELSTLDSFGLYVARNEIFARHGFIFGREDLKEYFSSKSWYVPTYTPEEYEALQSPTNEIENQNVQTILALERSISSPYI